MTTHDLCRKCPLLLAFDRLREAMEERQARLRAALADLLQEEEKDVQSLPPEEMPPWPR